MNFSGIQAPDFTDVVDNVGPMLQKLNVQGVWMTKKAFLWGFKKCPNIKSLSVHMRNPGFGIDGQGEQKQWLGFKHDDTLPQLSEMSITSRVFGPRDMQVWGEKGGWTRLQRVTLRDPLYLHYLQGYEKSLRSIHIINPSSEVEEPLSGICQRVVRLDTLAISGREFVAFPLGALKACGNPLKLLDVHTFDSPRLICRVNAPIETLETCDDIAQTLPPSEWTFVGLMKTG